MKKIIAAGALALVMPLAAQAGPSDAGCGLGSVLLADQEDTLVMNVLGATLNGISGNQTFGMTTGTLNCSQDNSLFAVQTYVNDNLDALAMDAARGEGESLETLASVWGVADEDKAVFIQATRTHFDSIFTSEAVTSQEVLSNLNQVVSEDAQLAAYTLS